LKKLNDDELDQTSDIAVEAAEKYILSRVSPKEILDMDIQANISYDEELHVDILVDIDLDELSSADEEILADGAVQDALKKLDIFIDENFR
jgi:hypothetical protein